MRTTTELGPVLDEVVQRLQQLEHQAELIKTVLIVKEPGTVQAASAYDGLRKQVMASASERRSHLAQLVTMAVAVGRARTVDDLRPQLQEWLTQAGVVEVAAVPEGFKPQDVFEDVDGGSLEGASSVEVVEPAFVDGNNGSLLRLGRARATAADAERAEVAE